MKNQYVPKTLTEFLTESKSITLKRKYGERPTITAGTNAPLRNQVLSFVAESGTVDKRELKAFILGLKEDGAATVAAANMFLKRNAKYFITESRDGITYFKLSNLGHRLVSQFIPEETANVSESVKNARQSLSLILESARKKRLDEQTLIPPSISEDDDDDGTGEETPEFEVPEDGEVEADAVDGEGPAAEIDFEDEVEEPEEGEEEGSVETDQFEYEEDDEKIVLTYYKNGSGEAEEDEDEEDLEPEEGEEELEPEEGEEELEPEEGEEGLEERPEEESREFDFKDKGRPGVLGMDESVNEKMQAQFVLHTLAGKKSSKLAGRYGKEYHNLLDDNEDKDENEIKDNIVKTKETSKLHEKSESKLAGRYSTAEYHNLLDDNQNKDEKELDTIEDEVTEANNLGGKYGKEYHNLLGDEDKDEKEDELNISEHDARVQRMREIIENLKNKRGKKMNEADEPSEDDELKDEDLDKIDLDDETAEETPETPEEGEVEKVEITEFIITVDDVDAALDELEELGITAERVPVEKPEEEVPAEVEEEPAPEEAPVEEPTPEPEAQQEAFRKFVAGILNEAEEDQKPEDLGTSDELGLGDQGEDATELEEPEGEEPVEATQEFEENKIKVKAEDWDTLKGWLEEKGVDVKEMFGGDIETEEVSDEEPEGELEPAEVSDDEIDFSGIGDDDKTKVKDEKEGKVKEAEYPITAEARLKAEEEKKKAKKEEKEVEECSGKK